MTRKDFKPGDKVAMVSRSGWYPLHVEWKSTVEKVDKRGLVTVRVSNRKYRQDGSEAGGSRYPSARLELLTPELEAEIAEADKAREAKALCRKAEDYFRKAAHHNPVAAVEDISPALLAKIKALGAA